MGQKFNKTKERKIKRKKKPSHLLTDDNFETNLKKMTKILSPPRISGKYFHHEFWEFFYRKYRVYFFLHIGDELPNKNDEENRDSDVNEKKPKPLDLGIILQESFNVNVFHSISFFLF